MMLFINFPARFKLKRHTIGRFLFPHGIFFSLNVKLPAKLFEDVMTFIRELVSINITI